MHLALRLAVLATAASNVAAIAVDVNNPNSVSDAAGALAATLYTYHDPSSTIGQFQQPEPWFWWLSGSAWTALIDYTAYTNDYTYVEDIQTSLSRNLGPALDFAPASQAGWEANDDQAYWVYNALTALEYGFPSLECQPSNAIVNTSCANSWYSISVHIFEEFVNRWQYSDDTCNGGLTWQYNAAATGNSATYKNTVTNGGFFQLAARLARYTNNATYADWATQIYDWTEGVGLIADGWHVYDGTSIEQNCSVVNAAEYSYNVASYIHGTANMFAYHGSGNGSEGGTLWEARTHVLIGAANESFFSPFPNATGIMYETMCEFDLSCDTDQASFKGSLARWMSKAAVLVPSTKEIVMDLLTTSAQGAAASCSGLDGSTCGEKWYVGGYDGARGFGQQLAGLEVMLSLMVDNAPKLATLSANSSANN